MIRYFHISVFVAIVGSSAFAADPEKSALAPILPGAPMVVNGLMGTINGQPVFVDDVLRPLDGNLRSMAAVPHFDVGHFHDDARELIYRQVQGLIDDVLMASAAGEGLDDTDKQRVDLIMNRAKKELITRFGGSEATAERAMELQGTTMEKELADQRRSIVREVFLRKTLIPKIQVTRQQLLAEYNLHIQDKFTVAPQIEMFSITIPISKWFPKEPDPENSDHTKPIDNPTPAQVKEAINLATENATELIKQLKGGADFGDLAARNSSDTHRNDGGRWKNLKRGTLASQAWEDEAFSLPANTIGKPVLINGDKPQIAGVVIVKVGDVTPGHVISFADAQDGLDHDMRERQFQILSGDYMKTMRDKAAVEGVDRMIDTATNAAVSRYASR